MFSPSLESRVFGSPSSPTMGLMDHPVFSVMPSVVRSLISAEARRLTLCPGEEAPEQALIFVMTGALALVEIETGMAAGVLGPGAFLGGVGPGPNEPASRARAISTCTLFSAPLSLLLEMSGAGWSTRFLSAHALSRARFLGSERLCRQQHSADERLAKWSLRLGATFKQTKDDMDPAELASLLGMPPQTFLAAWERLSQAGGLSEVPGRLADQNREVLCQMACQCDHEMADGGIERRSRRRLLRRN